MWLHLHELTDCYVCCHPDTGRGDASSDSASCATTNNRSYVPDDYFFEDNEQPHVANQCECFQSIDVIAADVTELYIPVREAIVNSFYDGVYPSPPNSCDPINQALFWLSTGNTRDVEDFNQRFVLALTYFALNGTLWDL